MHCNQDRRVKSNNQGGRQWVFMLCREAETDPRSIREVGTTSQMIRCCTPEGAWGLLLLQCADWLGGSALKTCGSRRAQGR